MKTWKLVSGIISIVLFVFVMFQSCAAGVANSLEANGESGGSAGLIVAIILLAGGFVSWGSHGSENDAACSSDRSVRGTLCKGPKGCSDHDAY